MIRPRRFPAPHRRSPWVLLLLLAAGWPSIAPADGASGAQPTPAAAIEVPKSVVDLRTMEKQFQEVAAKVTPCTVGVQIGAAQGSGVIVSEDGYVMTAGHVVGKPGQSVTFFLADGRTVQGKTLGMFKDVDAGLMKIEAEGKWPFVEKGHSADLAAGTWCIAIGHPFGYVDDRPPVVRVGRILRSGETLIQTDCPLVAGDSGGPLLDLAGHVIGINSRIGPKMDINLHVPVDVFHDHWDRLAQGDAWEVGMRGRDHDEIKAAFCEVVARAGRCVVRVQCDGQDVALGTIVGPDGWILTKASELEGKIVCRLRDNQELPATIVGVDERFDLAILRVETADLPYLEWAEDKPDVGQWLASPGEGGEPLAVGVLSVPQRKVPPESGMLGVALVEGKDGAEIERVVPKSPAEKAQLKPHDVITHVDGKPTANRKELIAAIQQHHPGTEVQLTVKRGDQELEVQVTLGRLTDGNARKRDVQNRMGGGLSERRHDFPAVLQHDSVVEPVDCGGPLVDLSGKVVGVNIARGGRTETYCVPTEVLLPRLYDLISGRLSPKLLAQRKAEQEKREAEAAMRVEEERKQAEAARQAEQEAEKPEDAEGQDKAPPEQKPEESKPDESKPDESKPDESKPE